MASLDLQLIDAVLAALRVPGGPAGLTVHESQNRPLDGDSLPAIVVYPATGQAAADQDELEDSCFHQLPLVVECRARGDPGHRAVDPLYVWAMAQMMADQQWGGLAEHTDFTGKAWAEEPLDAVYGRIALFFALKFRTAETDVERQQ